MTHATQPRTTQPMATQAALVDGFGRVHTSLRISVTDRCNIRCFYCMPAENVQFRPKDELLTFEEITRFVRVVARLGVNKVRLTGGEPLVRNHLPRLVRMLRELDGIREIALTTNGILLAEQAAELHAAGVQRLNISLDTLDPQKFVAISRREGLERVLAGIEAAQRVGFHDIKLNALAIRGLTEEEIVPLARFAAERGLELRFIEYMPLDADGAWDISQVLPGGEIRRRLEAELGSLEPVPRDDPAQPATDFRVVQTGAVIGLIHPVTEPFCEACNRLRLTAEGQVRNCLFSIAEWDARALLRAGASDDEIAELVRDCVQAKKRAHGINRDDFEKPARAMYQIGG